MPELTPADIRQVWDDVRPGLEKIQIDLKQEWRPEDIYAACISGEYVLYMADEGFLIVGSRENEFTSETELFIWVAYGVGIALIDKYLGTLENLAREIGATKLVFESPRPGFARQKGWKFCCSTYERDITG